MERKQKECFHGEIVAFWGLEEIEAQVRETAEFVNLYSRMRGRNRFISLYDVMRLLRKRTDLGAAADRVPSLEPLHQVILDEASLSNDQLQRIVTTTHDGELSRILAWSKAVNARIAARAKQSPVFEGVDVTLREMWRKSDCMVVSQTPEEALQQEWHEAGLARRVFAIAGQECGTKIEQMDAATKDRYAAHAVLMVGDAPGDLDAARANGASFYPIVPGRETQSWHRLQTDAYPRFLAGTYHGAYEDDQTLAFEKQLPAKSPWE